MASKPTTAGRRAAARLRLSLPGVFLAVGGNYSCIITNLSQTGALVAVSEELKVGEEGYLRCGPIDHFVVVARKEKGLNAVEFEIPLSYDFVVQVREFQETMAQREEAELMEQVRNWTQGSDPGRI